MCDSTAQKTPPPGHYSPVLSRNTLFLPIIGIFGPKDKVFFMGQGNQKTVSDTFGII
jgi:hypothetical protein